jgi:hypothetical protein
MRVFAIVVFSVLISVSVIAGESRWYKGNTHAHTTLCGHADSTPEAVTAWYHEHGYNFLCLSEHNQFIDPAIVPMPKDKRADFILVPGQEVTGKTHMTALNVMQLVKFDFKSAKISEVIQNHTDGTLEAKGTPILNHPNFQWAVKPSDIMEVKRLHMFELFNGHPTVNNAGDEARPSTEKVWDYVLSNGLVMYGVSSDDVHTLKKWGPKISNAGRGWVMVRSAELTPDAIAKAMQNGDFYSSSGVMLKDVSITKSSYSVEVDEAATAKELDSPILYPNRTEKGEVGCRIEWIGADGKVLNTVNGTKASFPIEPANPYVRCKVTVCRKDGDSFIEACAWTQPVFTDGRVEKLQR